MISQDIFSWQSGVEHRWMEQIDTLIGQHRAASSVRASPPAGSPVIELPRESMAADDYFEKLLRDGLDGAARMHHGRCLGHMTSPLPAFMPHLSRLVTALNQNLMKTESSGRLTVLERTTLLMLHRLVFGLDDQRYRRMATDSERAPGVITCGGSTANLTAMWCARRRSFPGRDAWWRELHRQGYVDAVIIGSRLMHYSFDKAVDLLGMSPDALVKLDVDAAGALRLDELDATLAVCRAQRRKVLAIVGVAGSTEFGSIDPLHELARRAREEGIHFHVDAAWGGPFLLSERNAGLLKGIELADTVTLDAHKQLLTPLGTGILLYRDSELSRASMATAPYAVRPGSWDGGRFTLEGSRPANAIYLHAALHLIGRQGFERYIDQSLERARGLARRIDIRPDFELLHEPPSNLVVFRYLPSRLRCGYGRENEAEINALNVQLHKQLRQAGTSFLSRTDRVLPGREGAPLVMLRAVMFNPLCRMEDLDPMLDEVAACGALVKARMAAEVEGDEYVRS